jgi:hypothetical protein
MCCEIPIIQLNHSILYFSKTFREQFFRNILKIYSILRFSHYLLQHGMFKEYSEKDFYFIVRIVVLDYAAMTKNRRRRNTFLLHK